MTRDDFERKYRGRMLLFLTEAWAARRAEPSALGLVVEDHARQLKLLRDEMYRDLSQKEPATAGAT